MTELVKSAAKAVVVTLAVVSVLVGSGYVLVSQAPRLERRRSHV